MSQVVGEVCGRASVIVLLTVVFFSVLSISGRSISMYLMSSIMTRIHIFMKERKKPPQALHAWLIMLKAW